MAPRITAAALVILAAAAFPAAGGEAVQPQIQAVRLGEKAVIVHDGGMGSQLAVNARNGIVVFDTLWCTRIARALRGRIEKEFGRSDFAAVVLTNGRLDYVGGGLAYPETPLISQERVRDVLARQKADLQPHLQPLIDMWRWKEDVSRRRQPSHEPGSRAARVEENWTNTCKTMADDLAGDYELVLPARTFGDRMSLDLGDMKLELIRFGVGARGEAGLVARIPQLKLVLFGRLLFHEQHLLPYLNASPWQSLDIPHTLSVLDEILADKDGIETVIVTSGPWSLAEIEARRRYLGDLWNEVKAGVERGMTLDGLQRDLTVDAKFPYLKDLPVWKNQGAEWCAQEHVGNVERCWGQFQKYAAREVFNACLASGADAALAKYAEMRAGKGGEYLFDDASLASLVDALRQEGFTDAALAVARLNVESFPGSWLIHYRLAESLLVSGDAAGALASFRRALELNPEHAGIKAAVERLEKR